MGHRQLELTADDFARAEDVVRELLAGGAHADRAELLAAFVAAGVSTTGQRGVHLIGYLATTGVIVLRGQKSYALLTSGHPDRSGIVRRLRGAAGRANPLRSAA